MVDNYRGEFDPPHTIICQQLTTTGNSSATGHSAIGAYSASAGKSGEFYMSCPANQKIALTRMLVKYTDTALSANGYGAAAALGQGIKVQVRDSGGSAVLDLTPTPIRTNGDWGAYCYDVSFVSAGAAGGDAVALARWTFEKSGRNIVLTSGMRFSVILTDDMTHLTSQVFTVQGHRRK
jgi:hypothetical protein